MKMNTTEKDKKIQKKRKKGIRKIFIAKNSIKEALFSRILERALFACLFFLKISLTNLCIHYFYIQFSRQPLQGSTKTYDNNNNNNNSKEG